MDTLPVPSDGSENSIRAVSHAVEMVKERGGGPVARLLPGSVSSRVACLVDAPVTLVK